MDLSRDLEWLHLMVNFNSVVNLGGENSIWAFAASLISP